MTDPIARLKAALADRYDLERVLGTGGMATVYLARDLKHGRPVAIKFLRPELAASIGADRFLHEIDVAARLQHPHIVPLYDSGSADGTLYYVMPFVEGESLRDRLDRDRRLPLAEAVSVGREVAGALGYAHDHGVIHRDIKPENIMLSGGHALVTDFGIARAIDAAGSGMTGTGLAIGTPAYMSPEQATASDDVGPRSDLYALGCVLYEMLAGEQAFSGPSVQSVIMKSVSGPRPQLRKVRGDVPAAIDVVLQKTLASDPALRYPGGTELARALAEAASDAAAIPRRSRYLIPALVLGAVLIGLGGWWLGGRQTGGVSEGAERIAVLPFTASGSDLQIMGEGMVDLLSTNLNGVGAIRTVDSRTVLNRWRKRGGAAGDLTSALAVAKDVDAGSVLLGSVVEAGRNVRLTADLYSRDGKAMAHAQVDGQADSVLTLVDQLSIALLRDVWRSGEPVPSLNVAAITTRSPQALRTYLQGEQFYRRSQWDSAAAAFNRAIESDSTFALAALRLSTTYGWSEGYAAENGRRAASLAAANADRLPPRERRLLRIYQMFEAGSLAALDSAQAFARANPQDVEAWYTLGDVQYHNRSRRAPTPEQLLAPFDSALKLDPSLTPALIHPLELTLGNRDSVRYSRYLQLMDSSAGPGQARPYHLAYDAVWPRALGSVRDSALRGLLPGKRSLIYGAQYAMTRSPTATADSVIDFLERIGRAQPLGSPAPELGLYKVDLLAALGQLQLAAATADSLTGVSRDLGLGSRWYAVTAGLAPGSFLPAPLAGELQRALKLPRVSYFLAMTYVALGKPAEARKLLAQTLALDSVRSQPALSALLTAADAWAQVIAGDTVGGLPRVRAALDRIPFEDNFATAPIRFRSAAMLAANPSTRAEGIRRLKYEFDNDPLFPATYLPLARALEDSGDKEGAAQAYGQFLRLWNKADPALQPRVAEARQALQELVGEKR